METETYSPKPGDLCRILDNFQVEHWYCDEHSDGTITNVLTGEVVSRRG